MGNQTPDWMLKWARSPRQDRRVIVNGKFVELTDPILPEVAGEETQENAGVLPQPVENSVVQVVLDGETGRVVSSEPEVTVEDIDKAIASIPPPETFADYGKTYTVHPGGTVTENPPAPKAEYTEEDVDKALKFLNIKLEPFEGL